MSKEPDPIYMEVFSLDLRPSFFRVSREQKENLLMEINQTLSAFRDGEVSLKLYRSIRYDYCSTQILNPRQEYVKYQNRENSRRNGLH